MAQVTVKHKFIHQAPRKIRLVASIARGLPVEQAVAELASLPQTASGLVRKTILSASAAAREKGLDSAALFIQSVTVDEGPKLRRAIPASRGRSRRILKRMSHLTLSLTDEPTVIASSQVYRKELQWPEKPISKKSPKTKPKKKKE